LGEKSKKWACLLGKKGKTQNNCQGTPGGDVAQWVEEIEKVSLMRSGRLCKFFGGKSGSQNGRSQKGKKPEKMREEGERPKKKLD